MKRCICIVAASVLQVCAVSDLELINAQSAYDDGITGSGIKVGIIDGAVRSDHPSLSGKLIEQIYSKDKYGAYTPDFTIDTHGSHVAGIMAGKYINASNPYGVAYDASIYAAQITGHNNIGTLTPPNIYDFFVDKDVSVINNSWNANMYPIVSMQGSTYYVKSLSSRDANFFIRQAYGNSKPSENLSRLSRDKNTLVVFAAGNEGIVSPGLFGTLPYYDESFRSWLVVGALDSANISKDSNGKIIISSKGSPEFSNGLKGTQNYSLVAPGTNINNVNSPYMIRPSFGRVDRNLYTKKSGTSMAAPMVSGAAALVAQKFPFLNGKEIADVLLSTANRDYQAPKVVIKETNGLDSDRNSPYFGTKINYYAIFYIDNPIPRKDDGSIDKDQINIDLMNAGYDRALVAGLSQLNNIKYPTLSSHVLVDGGYAAVWEIKKEDMFGQGILDVKKAMGGLSVLDANRLSHSDIVQNYKQESSAVYYKLDTKGMDAEFSNDISQRKWDSSTHNAGALNLPIGLADLNVGFIKNGNGVLKLTGENSYLGATIVRQGGLNISKRADQSGGFISSNVYVENTASLSGDGVIDRNLYNDGIVRPGNQDLSDLTVNGTYEQSSAGTLQLDFGDKKNSKLIAANYNIQGKLEYIPLPAFYTSGSYVSIDLGGLKAHLNDFSNVAVVGNNAINFIAVLDEDKTSINKPDLPQLDINEQDKDNAADQKPDQNPDPILPEPDKDPNPSNPVHPIEPAPKPSDKEDNISGPTQDEVNKPDQNQDKNPDSNNNHNDSDKNPDSNNNLIVTPTVKPDAYNRPNSDIGAALREIRSMANLDKRYKDYFAFLDNADSKNFDKALKTMESIDYMSNTAQIVNGHHQFNQNSMLFALNPTSQGLSLARNFETEPILLASLASDIAIDLGINSYDEKRYIWYMSPSYKKINGDNYSGKSYGLNFTIGAKPSDNSQLTFNTSYLESKLNFEDSNSKSKYVNFGSNYILDLDSVKVLSGASLGFGRNTMQRGLLGSSEILSGSYNNFLASAEFGLAKDLKINSFTITPLSYFSYSYIFQDSFNESGNVFAKSYDKIRHDSTSITAGINLSYDLDKFDVNTKLSGFVIYEYRLSGKDLKNRVKFRDFQNQTFTQRYALNRDLVYLGFSSQFDYTNSFFMRFDLINEIAKDQYNFNILANLGFKF